MMEPVGSTLPGSEASSGSPPPRILHLCFLPPFAPGSYNRFLGTFLLQSQALPQAMVSFWKGAPPAENPWGERLVLVDGRGLSLRRRLGRRLPERWRGFLAQGITGRDTLAYAWEAVEVVRRMRPSVVVCYDGRKLGPLLRGVIDWPCRLVLAQHGLSYHLPPDEADRVYSLASFDVVWTLTKASYRYDAQRGQIYEPSVFVLSNGVDTSVFRPSADPEERRRLREAQGLPLSRPVVLFLSRLVPKKGAHLVLEAWDRVLAQVPEAFLWIVGGGDKAYAARLASTARALGVEASVRLHGALAPEQVPEAYRAADVYVFPSVCGEGQGKTLLEAMASGVASCAPDTPVLRELYREDEVRFVPDPNLGGRFVEPIVGLLRDDGARRALGMAGASAARERFSEADRMERLTGFLQEQVRLAGRG